MDEFIQMAMKSLGSDEKTTRAATGGLLNLLHKKAGGADFKQLLGALPGAEGLMKQGPSAAGSGIGGMLGDLVGEVTGGDTGASEAVGELSFITRSGLDIGKVGTLVTLFLQFARSKAGADLVQRILGHVPELQKIGG